MSQFIVNCAIHTIHQVAYIALRMRCTNYDQPCSLSQVFQYVLINSCGRHGRLVVSALDPGSRGLGLSPGRVIVFCSWARHFTLTVPLPTQEYKWVPANCQGNLTKCGGLTCDGLASHPGGVAIFLVASCYRKLRQSWATRLIRLNLINSYVLFCLYVQIRSSGLSDSL